MPVGKEERRKGGEGRKVAGAHKGENVGGLFDA